VPRTRAPHLKRMKKAGSIVMISRPCCFALSL
jgi:hypothetical protein